ncbi:MAG: YdcF family protein [Rhodospirillales bacterium]|nr:YdcF family protein [Rhodospirillales bacterium]
MFFYLSKILWFVVEPGNLLLIILCVGVVLLWTPWRTAGKWGVTLAAVLAVFMATTPAGKMLIGVLEDRIERPESLPDAVDGVIVLGGVVSPALSDARGEASLNGASERLFAFSELAARYPKARLVFTGGSGELFDQKRKEAHYVGPIFNRLGTDLSRIVFEDRSRNTFENAVFSHELVAPVKGENWIVITSAFHMPRALGCFRKLGWDVIPYPVDFVTDGMGEASLTLSLQGGIGYLSAAMHEWLGLVFYWLTGKTDAVFPALSPR